MSNGLLTAADVAAHYGVSTSTVWRWVREHKLTPVPTPSGRYRFDQSALTVRPTTEPAA